jgi:hypothetical protein
MLDTAPSAVPAIALVGADAAFLNTIAAALASVRSSSSISIRSAARASSPCKAWSDGLARGRP